MLVRAIPRRSATNPPSVSRSPAAKGLSILAQKGRPCWLSARVSAAGGSLTTIAAASVPAAGSTASGSAASAALAPSEDEASVMGHTLEPGGRPDTEELRFHAYRT